MRLHWHHLRRAMGQVLSYPEVSVTVWQEHDRIVTAMIRGDANDAAELMRRHTADAFKRIQNAQLF
jgi:DNA-binding GntR family transcriptional regulator